MKTAKEFMVEYSEKKGYDTDIEVLIDTLFDDGEIVYRGEKEKHDGYYSEILVIEIDGTFIRVRECVPDYDYRYWVGINLDAAKIVERKERQGTEVYYEEVKE